MFSYKITKKHFCSCISLLQIPVGIFFIKLESLLYTLNLYLLVTSMLVSFNKQLCCIPLSRSSEYIQYFQDIER